MFRSRRRLSTALGAALAIGAISAPAANAVTSEDWRASSGSTPASESTNRPAPTVIRTVDEGFDLGSAAIGAGSAATILLLGGGVTMIARRRVRLAS